MGINRKIEFQTISDFIHHEVRLNFGNNEMERKRKEKALELLSLVAEFNIKGFIMEMEDIGE